MTQLLGEFVSHYSKCMRFIFRNIRKFSPVWVWFRVSTVLPFKKWVEKVSYFLIVILVWLGYIKIFTYSGIYVLNFRNQIIFFPSLSCKKHLLASWHQSFVTLSCRISSFSNLYFRTKLQRKKNLWRVLLFHGTHAPISLLLLSLCAAAAPTLRLCSVRENKVGDILLHQTFSLRHHVTCKCTQSQHIHYRLFICLAVLSEDVEFDKNPPLMLEVLCWSYFQVLLVFSSFFLNAGIFTSHLQTEGLFPKNSFVLFLFF